MNLVEHPYEHLARLASNWPDAILELSVYQYEPQSLLDSRTFVDVPASDFNASRLKGMIDGLAQDEELAFHSIVKRGKRPFHIPMIDFVCPPEDVMLAKAMMRKVLDNTTWAGLQYYNSGRSLHAYGSLPLTKKKWVEFMGRLLLANLPGEKPVVDARWIGHRLVGGFSSLRLSANSKHYLGLPRRIS